MEKHQIFPKYLAAGLIKTNLIFFLIKKTESGFHNKKKFKFFSKKKLILNKSYWKNLKLLFFNKAEENSDHLGNH